MLLSNTLYKTDSSEDYARNRIALYKSDSSEENMKTGELSSVKSFSDQSLSSLSSGDESFKCYRHADVGFNRMESFFLQNQLTDITLKAGDKVINAHIIVLCAASDYFTAMFMNDLKESNNKEIIFPEIDGEILQKLIHYCYTGKVDLHEDTVESMLSAASILQLNGVIKDCCTFLKKQLHPSNCIGICLFADYQNCQDLKEAAYNYTADCFMDVIQNQEFLGLPEDGIYKLLLSDDLNVPNEEEIFKALMKWAEYNEPVRSKNIGKLLGLVRLPLLPPAFIVDYVETKSILMNDPTCQALISEAKTYHIRRLQFGAAIIDSKICIVGGRDGLKTLNTAECFDLKAMAWTNLPPMSTSRHGLGITVFEGPLYAVGGHDGWSYLNTVERLDIELKQWSFVAPMSMARSTAGVAVLDKFLYAVGGRDGSLCLKTVERYDPHTNKWTLCSSMIKRRGSVGVGVLNGYLYAVGGHDAPASNPSMLRCDCVERYDPTTDSWTIIANMSIARDSIGVGILGHKLFAVGGYDGQTYLSLVETYNPITNEWKQRQKTAASRKLLVSRRPFPFARFNCLIEMHKLHDNDDIVFVSNRVDAANYEHFFENSISNDFDNVNVIGNGAYGTVYKARERATGNYVALKRIKISITEDGLPLSAVREITALKHLHYHDHPNIVKLIDTCQGRIKDTCLVLFLVFEHIDQNLAEYINKYRSNGKMELEKIKNFSRQLINGVDFLHSHRIIHRDLKPQNVLISDNGQLKIADFGLAKIYDFEMRLTSVVQTLWYRAPEVILGLSYTTAIDIWACGCIIAEMFLKKPIFPGTSEVDQLDRIFQIIGTPSAESWPDNVSLEKNVFLDWPSVCLKSLIQKLDTDGSDLLSNMLTFNPNKRINAKNSLLHSFLSFDDENNRFS
ncbi:hypothetical protein PGB90_001954 [Kerria lacca]